MRRAAWRGCQRRVARGATSWYAGRRRGYTHVRRARAQRTALGRPGGGAGAVAFSLPAATAADASSVANSSVRASRPRAASLCDDDLAIGRQTAGRPAPARETRARAAARVSKTDVARCARRMSHPCACAGVVRRRATHGSTPKAPESRAPSECGAPMARRRLCCDQHGRLSAAREQRLRAFCATGTPRQRFSEGKCVDCAPILGRAHERTASSSRR